MFQTIAFILQSFTGQHAKLWKYSKALTAMVFKTFIRYSNVIKKISEKQNATLEAEERFGYYNKLTF